MSNQLHKPEIVKIILEILFLLAVPVISFATLTIRKPKPKQCPFCDSTNVFKRRHRGDFALPECEFDYCEDCDAQFNHQ